MQFLSPDVLTNIFNLLPWKDALRLEALSSQFRDLPYQPKAAYRLIMTTTYEDITFHIFTYSHRSRSGRRPFNRMHVLHICYNKMRTAKDLKKYQKEKMKSRSQWERRELKEMAEKERQVFPYCTDPEKLLEEAAQLAHRLLRRFTFSEIEFDLLPGKLFSKLGPLNSDIFEQTELCLVAKRKTMERIFEFLSHFKKIRFLYIDKCGDFEELLSLPCMQKGGQLRFTSRTLHKPKVNLNDEFLQKIIDRKIIHFDAFATCFVSFNFLVKYVRDCLYGKIHTMHYLNLQFQFDKRGYADGRFFPAEYKEMGFQTCDILEGKFADWLEKEVETSEYKEGYDPDKILIWFASSYFKMIADFACYRGRKSLVRPGAFLEPIKQ